MRKTDIIIEKSHFSKWLINLNQLQKLGFKRWVFRPGMLFQDNEKWWDADQLRDTPHEGIDFCCFEDKADKTIYLNPKTNVPVMFDGEVIRIFNDLLGHSILVAHQIHNDTSRLCSIYAHSLPDEKLKIGHTVMAGEIIASISTKNNSPIAPHIHISTIWVDAGVSIQTIHWGNINDPNVVTLCDPFDFMEEDVHAL